MLLTIDSCAGLVREGMISSPWYWKQDKTLCTKNTGLDKPPNLAEVERVDKCTFDDTGCKAKQIHVIVINLFQNNITFMNIDYSFSEHFKRKWKSLLSLKCMRFVQPRNYSTVYYLFWIAVSSSCVLISLHHAFNYK